MRRRRNAPTERKRCEHIRGGTEDEAAKGRFNGEEALRAHAESETLPDLDMQWAVVDQGEILHPLLALTRGVSETATPEHQ